MSQYSSYEQLTSGLPLTNNELYYESQVIDPTEIYNKANINTSNNNNILNQIENYNDNNIYSNNKYQNQTISYDNNEYNNLLSDIGFNSDLNSKHYLDSSNYSINNNYSLKTHNNIDSYLTIPNKSDKIYYQTKNEENTIPQNFKYNNNYDNVNNNDLNSIGINDNSIHPQHKEIKPLFKTVTNPHLDYPYNTKSFHGSKTIESNNTLNYHTDKVIQLPNDIYTINDYNYNNEYIDNYNNFENDFYSLDNNINSTNNFENYGQDEIISNYDNTFENNYFNFTSSELYMTYFFI